MDFDLPPFGAPADSQVPDPDFIFDVAPVTKSKRTLKKRKSDALWDAEIELADTDLRSSRDGIDRLMLDERTTREVKAKREKASALVQSMLLGTLV
jgi:hypothetical protein